MRTERLLLTTVQFLGILLIFMVSNIGVDALAQSTTSSTDTIKSNIVGPLDFKGTVEELGKAIKGAIVTVYEDPDGSRTNLTEIKKIITPGNGTFSLKFEINKMYVIQVEKTGYTSKGIDIDTDVRMARSYYTKVPEFGFKVDMIKDTDGLAFKKSVANVFYQIKRNAFDYELDYSKEEMEEEERLLREQEEKRRLAELAAQKKFEMEEAAKFLREQENASMEEKIKAAITVGNGDKVKTIATLTEIFPVSDTLRARKAEVIYAELQKERQGDGKTTGDINFKGLFAAAQALEQQVAEEVDKQQEKKAEELRAVKEEAERKQEAAMAIQQQAMELEMREKIAKANIKAEEERRVAEKEKTDKIYFAIFNANGDRKTAVSNLVKSYPKGDPYAEKKAEAIFAEYEKARLTGTTLAKMDYSSLFAAADAAEQEAVKEEIALADAKERAKTEAYLKKEEEQKAAEQKKLADGILERLKTAPSDDNAQRSAFVESFPANDPYREQKGQAMYAEYVEQQKAVKKTGSTNVALDFGSMFAAAEVAEQEAKREAKELTIKQKAEQQDELDRKREELRQEKIRLGEQAAKEAQQVHVAKMNEAKNKKEQELGRALEAGGGDRDRTVKAIMETFPKGTEMPEMKAQAMFDAYLSESKRLKETGGVGAKLDYSALFQAAEQAELYALQRQFEENQAVQQEQLLAYEETRVEKTKEAAQVKAQEAVQELAVAEKKYEETAQKVEQERLARIKEEQQRKQEFEKQLAMEQAKREALEKDRQEQELAKLEDERKKRLSEEEAEKERLAAAKLEEQRKAEEAAKAEADRQFAAAEKERRLALEAQRKAEEERQKEEARKLAAEEAAKAEAARLAAKTEAERIKAEELRLAAEEKARIAEEQAAAKAEAERIRQAELAAAEETKRKEEEAKRIAAAKEEERQAEIARLTGVAQRAVSAKDYAAARAAFEQVLAVDPSNKEANAGVASAQAELDALAKAEAERKALDEKYRALVAKGEQEMASGQLAESKQTFAEASKLKPYEKEAKDLLAEAERREIELAAAEEEKRQLERRYVLLIQEAEQAMGANNLAVAKLRYEEASKLKPEESVPTAKLQEIAGLEQQLAAAAEEKRQREAEAKRKFQEEQKAAEEARKEAMAQADANKAKEQKAAASAEEDRARKFDELKENIEKLQLNAEDQRKAFLSELAKLYPEGLTEETVDGKNYQVLRYVINESDIVTVYEKRTWDWGGVFWFKNGDIAITESLYKLELSKYGK